MKCIVVYYSYGGNTRTVAERIAQGIGADVAEIKTLKPYTGSYESVVNQGQNEVNQGYRPELQPVDVDFSQYDTVVLGTPVWWYTFAPAMSSFLHNTDLSGKDIYPFATNGGWLGHTFQDFERDCADAHVHEGLNVRFNEDSQLTSEEEILKWVKGIAQ